MNSRDQSQLDAIVQIVDSLGARVVGSYYYGSGVLDVLRATSDIDVFVILNGATESEERRTLVAELMKVSGRHGSSISGRPVEVTMAQLSELRPWQRNPLREFQYGEWLRDDYEAGFIPVPVADPDLAAQVATLLAASRALIGPRVETLLEPVPRRALIDAMIRSTPELMDELSNDTVNVLLTLARIGYTISNGHIVTKDRAAEWAISQLPADLQDPLAQARLFYLGEIRTTSPALPVEAKRTAHHLEQIIFGHC